MLRGAQADLPGWRLKQWRSSCSTGGRVAVSLPGEFYELVPYNVGPGGSRDLRGVSIWPGELGAVGHQNVR